MPNKRNVYVALIVGFVVLVLDQMTKYLVRLFMFDSSVIVFENVFHLTFVKNTGALFGMFQNSNTIFIFITVVVIGFLVYLLKTSQDTKMFYYCNIGLLIGGAVGNLVDRIFFGYVIDFVDVRVWPVFNVADSAISVGIVLMITYLIYEESMSKKKKSSKA